MKMSARDLLLEKFTLDAEIEEWEVGDESTELHGYVNLIEGVKVVQSNGKPTNLYKITVNNGYSRRVKVCFWGDLAKLYSQQIQDRTVISISRGRLCNPKKKFYNPNDIIETLEIYVLPSTKITISNDKFLDDPVSDENIPLIEIENVHDHDGQCYIQGYLKQEFMKVTAYGASFWTGLLVNGNFKIAVKISQTDDTKNFTKGVFLRILGKLTRNSHKICAPVHSSQC